MPQPFSGPDFALTSAYPEIVPFRQAVTAQDWPSARAALLALNPALVEYAILDVAEADGVETFLAKVVEADAADTLAATAYAARLVVQGWEIRTGARARDVSREQFEAFHDHLKRAERLLIDVTARDPSLLAAWVWRLKTARGLELGHAEARRRHDQVAKQDPHFLPAQLQYLQQICPKWGGSYEEMHGYATERALAAPPGSPNPVLVAVAHIEHWLELDPPADERYFADGRVHEEIQQAAERSVLHPDHQRTPGWVAAASTFAMALSMIGDEARAARCFAALGPLAEEFPWYYLGDAPKVFTERRARALRKAGLE